MRTCSFVPHVNVYTHVLYEIYLESDATVNAACLSAVIQIELTCVILWQSTLLELRVNVYEILGMTCLDFAVGNVKIRY
jgi:hypothetical protein